MWHSRGQEQEMDEAGSITAMFNIKMSPLAHVALVGVTGTLTYLSLLPSMEKYSFKMYVHCHGSSTWTLHIVANKQFMFQE